MLMEMGLLIRKTNVHAGPKKTQVVLGQILMEIVF
jgi:hypothetical protein